MNSKTQYRIIAVLICIVIYVLYISLSVAIGWEHGGGFFVLVILVGILRAVWKGVTNLANKEDNTNETLPVPQDETLPEIPDDTELEQLPVEEEIPIPVEEVEESIPQEESEDLPPIPDIEEDRTTIAAPTEEPEMFNQQPKTHWQKFRLYYIIGIVLCGLVAIATPISIHIHKENKIEILLSEAINACENTFFDLALQHLDKAYALDSKNYAVNYYIGCVYCHKHNYEPARKYLETAYKINKKKEDCVMPFDTIGYDRLLYYYYISLKDYQQSDNQTEINQRTLIAQEYLTQYPNECDAYRCMVYESCMENSRTKSWEYFHCMEKYNPNSINLNVYTTELFRIVLNKRWIPNDKEMFAYLLFMKDFIHEIYNSSINENVDLDINTLEELTIKVADQIFPLDWQTKTHFSQQEGNKTTTTKQSVEKTKAKPSNVHNGHKFVDLGLSVKWATANIGANKPEDHGDYFAWSEVKTKNNYEWTTYKWCNYVSEPGSSPYISKYNTNNENGVVDNKVCLDREDDVAAVKWGGKWRMPTQAELQELKDNCTWTWTTMNGVKGYKVKSKKSGFTNQSIFLPAARMRSFTYDFMGIDCGYYWSSILRDGKEKWDTEWAWMLMFDSENINVRITHRWFGYPIRPVCP